MQQQFFFNPASAQAQKLTTSIQALELENEVWYIPPTIAAENEEDCGDYSNALQLVRDIKLNKGLRHWADLTGTFITGDFIEAFFTHFNVHAKCLYIDHYVLSENNIDSLALLLDNGYVDRIELMISDYWFRHNLQDLVPYIYLKLKGNNRFQMGVSRTHKKLVCFKTDNDTHIVIHGSANLRSSDADEHLMIEANEFLFNRLVPRIQAKIARYRTINEIALSHIENQELSQKEISNQLRQMSSLSRNESWQVDQESLRV